MIATYRPTASVSVNFGRPVVSSVKRSCRSLALNKPNRPGPLMLMVGLRELGAIHGQSQCQG